MIRLLRRLGRFPAGTETDAFDAAAEAAFILDGTAEPVAPQEQDAAPDYAGMKKDDLLKLAMARGLDVSPRAKVQAIVHALEVSDDAQGDDRR